MTGHGDRHPVVSIYKEQGMHAVDSKEIESIR
jgi:hypothetical protein